MGGALPVRTFLYKWVPLMNAFRFPSIFRVFFIIGFLLIAAWSFKALKSNYAVNKKKLIRTIRNFFA